MTAVDKLCLFLIAMIAGHMCFEIYIVNELHDAQVEIIKLKTIPARVVVKECPTLDIACPGWFFHADLLESRRRMCGK